MRLKALVMALAVLFGTYFASPLTTLGQNGKPSSPFGRPLLDGPTTEAQADIIPVELPPLADVPIGGPEEVAVRLRMARYSVRHPGQLWFVVNGNAYDVGEATFKFPEDKDPEKPIWSGTLKVGEVKALKVEACAYDTGVKFGAGTGHTKLNGFTVAVSNIAGKVHVQWLAPHEGTTEQEIFENVKKPRRTPPFMQKRKRFKLADGEIYIVGDFVVHSSDDVNPTPAQMNEIRSKTGATEGRVDPNSPIGKRLEKAREELKEKLEERKKGTEKFRQDQERRRKNASSPIAPAEEDHTTSLVLVACQTPPGQVVAKTPTPVVPKTHSEERKALLEKAVRIVVKPRGLPSWAGILWNATGDSDSTGLSAEYVKDEALIKEINTEFREAEAEARTIKASVSKLQSELTHEIEEKSKALKVRRTNLDDAELKGQTWANRRGQELLNSSIEFNAETKKIKSMPTAPSEPTAAEEANVRALADAFAKLSVFDRCPEGNPFDLCTHVKEKNEWLADRQKADDTWRSANQALIKKRDALAAHGAALNQAAAPLNWTKQQLVAARAVYAAKINAMNATNAKDRVGIELLDRELSFDLKPRLAAIKLLADELEGFLANPEQAINTFWKAHPKFNAGEGRAMPLLPTMP
jgi:hypothetical protein